MKKQFNSNKTSLTDFFPFPRSAVRHDIPLFFLHLSGCLESDSILKKIAHKRQFFLKSNDACNLLMRLVGTSSYCLPLLLRCKYLFIWSEDVYSNRQVLCVIISSSS